jgi:hypothetical protein
MSFINLMANDDWSDADIVRRTESLIASQFPNIQILQRKVQGQMLGQYTLTADEQAQLQAYAAASFAAGTDADQARADMKTLRSVWAVEAAQARLAEPVVDGDDQDASERAAAQAEIDAATPDVMTVVTERAQTTVS